MMLNETESSADIRSSPPSAKIREDEREGKAWGGRAESPAAKRMHVEEERQDGREGGPIAAVPLPSVCSPSTNASSRLPPPTVAPLTITPHSSSSSSPPFSSPFSTSNLFGLFERIANGSFIDTNFGINGVLPSAEILPNSQQQTLKMNSSALSFDEMTALSFGINGGQKLQNQQQTPATIDKLLQISQQFLNCPNEMNEEIGKKNGNKRTTNDGTTPRGEESNGTEREGTAAKGGGARGANAGGDGRKRSYPYTFQFCVLCQKNVHSSKLPCHIRQCHVGKPMFQCPVCDFTSTYSKNNVKSHMVSLHGLAGDPISYMDQYATQVEEFMKQCFPNVRGRGRPLHGRLSPNVKQQLAMPTTAVSSARSKPTIASGGNGAIAAPPAIVQSQGQLISSPLASAGPSLPQQQRAGGRQQKATPKQMTDGQPPMLSIGRSDAFCIPPFVTNNNTNGNDFVALLPFGVTDVHGAAMGMLKTTAGQRTPTSLLHNRDGGGADGSLLGFGKGGSASFGPLLQRDNGFLSSFNPFLYLQQINNLFAVNSVNSSTVHQQQMHTEQLGGGEERSKTENELNVSIGGESPHQQQMNSTLFLEECLNLSQKFLKEMSKDEEQRPNVANGETNDGKSDVAKELPICHSSSPTASPHPSGCFSNSANATTELDGVRREQNRNGAEEADGQSTAATTPNASRRPSNSSATAGISGSVEDELNKIKSVLRQHERRIRLLEDQLADANMANAYGL